MRSLLVAAVAGALLASAAIPGMAETAQQTKMTTCNADATAKALKGDERKAYMKSCLSSHPAPAAKPLNSQQMKMKSCNADATAKGLKGPERKAFVKSCLSSAG